MSCHCCKRYYLKPIQIRAIELAETEPREADDMWFCEETVAPLLSEGLLKKLEDGRYLATRVGVDALASGRVVDLWAGPWPKSEWR